MPNAAQDTIHLFCGKDTSLAPSQLGVSQGPRAFSAKLLSSWELPAYVWGQREFPLAVNQLFWERSGIQNWEESSEMLCLAYHLGQT